MSKWMSKLIAKHTCFNCKKEVDKKTAFSVKLNTAEGLVEFKACEECAKDLDGFLKEFEETFDGKRL